MVARQIRRFKPTEVREGSRNIRDDLRERIEVQREKRRNRPIQIRAGLTKIRDGARNIREDLRDRARKIRRFIPIKIRA